ncbi:MAG: hypothetical protein AAGI25_14935 [Bacteroidota bacterium]
MITASGRQFMDWSAAYRLFSEQRIDVAKPQQVCLDRAVEEVAAD